MKIIKRNYNKRRAYSKKINKEMEATGYCMKIIKNINIKMEAPG